MSRTLTGVAASPGLAAAPGLRWDAGEGVAVEPAPDIQTAARRVQDDLRRRAAGAPTAEGRTVLDALALFAGDPELLAAAEAAARQGVSLPDAVRAASGHYAEQLRSLGGYLAERAEDVLDVGARIIAALEGRHVAEIPNPGYAYVLVARDLAPADTALLDPTVVVALVTEQGGPTSHTAILARSLGLPAVVACAGARDAADGRALVVDGDLGEVHIDPPAAVVEALSARAERQRRRTATVTGPGMTKDSVPVALLANVGGARDAAAAAESEAEGIGLFRTEFLFLGRADEPSLDEQVEAYADVLAHFVGRRVVVRTLDAGSDKPLPFLGLGDEENPALGVRGLRTETVRPGVLERQLTALSAAVVRTGCDAWVMAPMVSTTTEARWFASMVRGRGLPTAGVMIEVPAAALRARDLLPEVDFASLGTNDLGQYTMAADRQCGDLGPLLDPWQPALLDLVAMACDAGAALGKPIGVCGEAAADPLLGAVLVGLGVGSLSMAAPALAAVRATLRDVDLATCAEAARRARTSPTAAEARNAASALLLGT
jgi:phosphotransferase system enzyme I (PtsI)